MNYLFNETFEEFSGKSNVVADPDRNTSVFGDTVDMAQRGLAQGVAGIFDFVGADGVADSLNNWADSQMSQLSDEGQTSMSKEFFTEDEQGNLKAGEALTDVRAWWLNLVSTAGQFASTGGAAGLGLKGASMATKFANAADKTKKIIGVGAFGATGGMSATGQMESQARALVDDFDMETLKSSTRFREIYQSVNDENPDFDNVKLWEASKDKLKLQLARDVKTDPKVLLSNFALSAISDPIIGKAFTKRIANSIIKSAGKGALAEGATETIQGGIESLAVNQVAQSVDPSIDPMAGVKAAALTEGLIGGSMGATIAGGGAMLDRPKKLEAPKTGHENLDQVLAQGVEQENQRQEQAFNNKAAQSATESQPQDPIVSTQNDSVTTVSTPRSILPRPFTKIDSQPLSPVSAAVQTGIAVNDDQQKVNTPVKPTPVEIPTLNEFSEAETAAFLNVIELAQKQHPKYYKRSKLEFDRTNNQAAFIDGVTKLANNDPTYLSLNKKIEEQGIEQTKANVELQAQTKFLKKQQEDEAEKVRLRAEFIDRLVNQPKRDRDYPAALAQHNAKVDLDSSIRNNVEQSKQSRPGKAFKKSLSELRAELKPKRKHLKQLLAANKATKQMQMRIDQSIAAEKLHSGKPVDINVYVPNPAMKEAFSKALSPELKERVAKIDMATNKELLKIQDKRRRKEQELAISNAIKTWVADENGLYSEQYSSMPQNYNVELKGPDYETEQDTREDTNANISTNIESETVENASIAEPTEDAVKKPLKADNVDLSTHVANEAEYHRELAEQAYSHSNRYGGRVSQSNYVKYINDTYEQLDQDLNPEQKTLLDDEIKKLKSSYLEEDKNYLSSRSGVVGAHIAGKSNFNAKQANSRSKSDDRASDSFDSWKRQQVARINVALSKARTPEQNQEIKDKNANKVFVNDWREFLSSLGAMTEKGFNKRLLMPGLTRAWETLKQHDSEKVLGILNKAEAVFQQDGTSIAKAIGAKSLLAKEINAYMLDSTPNKLVDSVDKLNASESTEVNSNESTEVNTSESTEVNAGESTEVNANELNVSERTDNESTPELSTKTVDNNVDETVEDELELSSEDIVEIESKHVKRRLSERLLMDRPAIELDGSFEGDFQDLADYASRLRIEATGHGRTKSDLIRAIDEQNEPFLIASILKAEYEDLSSKGLVPTHLGTANNDRYFTRNQLFKLGLDDGSTKFNRLKALTGAYTDPIKPLVGLDKSQIELDYLEQLLNQDESLSNQVRDRPWLSTVTVRLTQLRRDLAQHKDKYLNARKAIYKASLSRDANFSDKEFQSWLQSNLASFKAQHNVDYLMPSKEQAFTEFTERATTRLTKNKEKIEDWTKATLFDFLDGEDQLHRGELPFDEYKEMGQALSDKREAVRAEISGLTKTKIGETRGMFWAARHGSDKKSTMVESAFENLFRSLNVNREGMTVLIGMGFGEKRGPDHYIDQIKEKFDAIDRTQYETWQQSIKDDRAAAEAERERKAQALEDPQSIEDFHRLYNLKGAKGMTAEQWAIFDRLVADENLAMQEKSKTRTVEAINEDVNYTLHETKHSKKDIDLFVVSLGDRVDKDVYRELNTKAKQLGGYYSSYNKAGAIPGFQFKSEETRQDFLSLLAGDTVERTKVEKDTAETLMDKAIRLEEKAREELERPRNTNTSRRASMAASSIDSAERNMAIAQELKSLSVAISSGRAKYLKGVSQNTQRDLLAQLFNRLQREAAKDIDTRDKHMEPSKHPVYGYDTGHKWRAGVPTEEKVRHAKYPFVTWEKAALHKYLDKMETADGYKLAAQALRKSLNQTKSENAFIGNHRSFDKFLSYSLQHESAHPFIKSEAQDYNRLQKLGINGTQHLRAALVEYDLLTSDAETVVVKSPAAEALKYSHLKGMYKDNDFHNSPNAVVEEVIGYADIEPGMRVLEPSAGVGHIADAVADIVGKDGVDTVEMGFELRKMLEGKGYKPESGDFLEYDPGGEIYDRVVMNPPFSKDQDIDHILHAYSMLKPGGKLVAVTSSMAGDRSNKKNQAFRTFMDEHAADEISLPEGSFKDAINPTGVNTKIIVIDKPSSNQEQQPSSNEDVVFNLEEQTHNSGLSDKDMSKVVTEFLNVYKGAKIFKGGIHIGGVDELYSKELLESRPEVRDLARGSYTPRTDTLHIVRGRFKDRADLLQTLRHEILVHKGLGVFHKEYVENFLSQVKLTRGSKNSYIKNIWDEVSQTYKDESDYVQAEEFLARVAEDLDDTGFGQFVNNKIIHPIIKAIRRMLESIGLSLSTQPSEIKQELYRITGALRKGIEPRNRQKQDAGLIGKRTYFNIAPPADSQLLPKHLNKESVNKHYNSIKAKLRPFMLSLLPRRYLKDLAGDTLPAISIYERAVEQMDADRNELLNVAADTMVKWRKLADSNPESAKVMADLMHDATLANVDPSERYEQLVNKQELDLAKKQYQAAKKDQSDLLAIDRELNNFNALKERAFAEGERGAMYTILAPKFRTLPTEFQDLFKEVVKSYRDQNKARLKALLERIEFTPTDVNHKSKMRDLIRMKFEQSERDFYVPLQRFGDYFGSVKDNNGDIVEFSLFESQAEQETWINERKTNFKGQGYTIRGGKKKEHMNEFERVNPGFITEIMPLLNEEQQDEIYQLYLHAMPDLSMRKHFIHRKGVKGFHTDALRAYAKNMFHGSYQIARLKHSHVMEGALSAMRLQVDSKANIREANKASDIASEIEQRHAWIVSPTGSSIAHKATQFGFAWYLGATPAAALLNVTQTPIIALPVIGSRYGFTATTKELTRAGVDFIGGKGHIEKALSGDELEMVNELLRRGVLDKTMSHDLAGVSEGGIQHNPTTHKWMGYISAMFHHAERFNREVTSLAAYRLARKKGMDHISAIDEAANLTWESHFDYASANKARFMQNDTAKVLFLFRQHSLNMSARLYLDFMKILKPKNKAERVQGTKQFLGVLGMTGMFAGVAGLPLYSVVTGLAEMFGDDEDEPWDANIAIHQGLNDMFGKEVGGALMHGAFNALTPADMASRTSLNNLWFREPYRELEGRDSVQYYAEQLLGPIFGVALSFGTGKSLINEGQTYRGVESMLPKFARDILKAGRYSTDGVQNLSGADVVALEDVGIADWATQAFGFSPSKVAERYEQNSAVKGSEQRILQRRSLLLNRYALGKRIDDRAFLIKVKTEIQQFNKANPNHPITEKTVIQSLKRRQSYANKAKNGVNLNDRYRYLIEENSIH